jgi:hypothetical protein
VILYELADVPWLFVFEFVVHVGYPVITNVEKRIHHNPTQPRKR